MFLGENPYPILKDISPKLGINWYASCRSAHPPTAFLFVAPVAFLPWMAASALWGWLMLFAILLGLQAIGLSKINAGVITAILLFWPPVIFSLGQITPIWFLGVAQAYRFRNTNPLRSGIWIGIASLTKFYPAILLILLIIRFKWRAIVGFLLVWLVATSSILLISPNIIQTYLEVSRTNLAFIISWPHNGGWLPIIEKSFGPSGVAIILIILLFLIYLYRKDLIYNKEITDDAWYLLNFLSVALLPIAWTYSLLPLLPMFLQIQNPFLLSAALIPIFIGPSSNSSPLAAPLSNFIVLFLILFSWLYTYFRSKLISTTKSKSSQQK